VGVFPPGAPNRCRRRMCILRLAAASDAKCGSCCHDRVLDGLRIAPGPVDQGRRRLQRQRRSDCGRPCQH
ncbi:unnamed protein product, partial [Symbiodinium microadriaticum]